METGVMSTGVLPEVLVEYQSAAHFRCVSIGTQTSAQNVPRTEAAQLRTLNSQKAVAWVFVDSEAGWKVRCFRTLVLAEVVNSLLFATAERYVL